MQGGSTVEKNRWMLGDNLSLRVPIVQAPLGVCDGPRLAGAVSRGGGLGCLTVAGGDAVTLARQLRRVRALTPRPFAVAFTAQFQPDSLIETCLDAGVSAFHVFWWNGPRLAPRIRRAGGVALWQVGDAEGADEALERGASVLVAQGTQAGGQVRSPHPLPELVEQLRDTFGPSIPLVAGGGLATARDVASVLACGANAAMLGTRFLLTEESRAPRLAKARLLRATTEQLYLDPSLVGEWPCAPRRRLRTGRGDDHTSLYAGVGLTHITSLLPASEVVQRLSALV